MDTSTPLFDEMTDPDDGPHGTTFAVLNPGPNQMPIRITDPELLQNTRSPVDPTAFVVKDSGVREEYANGFVRDTEDGKPDYTRLLAIEGLELLPVEMLERWAAHMVKGAEKYGTDNWRKATGEIPRARFLRSLCRHLVQYIKGDRSEDHASAIMFNVSARELVPDDV